VTREQAIERLRRFRWGTLLGIFGCAHDSTVGFLAAEWIATGEQGTRSVIDVPPCVSVGEGRRRQADLLMFDHGEPVFVAEVETGGIGNYAAKVASLQAYARDKERFGYSLHGLLVMSSSAADLRLLDRRLLRGQAGDPVVMLLEIEKERGAPDRKDTSILSRVRRTLGSGWYRDRRRRVALYDAATDGVHLFWQLDQA